MQLLRSQHSTPKEQAWDQQAHGFCGGGQGWWDGDASHITVSGQVTLAPLPLSQHPLSVESKTHSLYLIQLESKCYCLRACPEVSHFNPTNWSKDFFQTNIVLSSPHCTHSWDWYVNRIWTHPGRILSGGWQTQPITPSWLQIWFHFHLPPLFGCEYEGKNKKGREKERLPYHFTWEIKK